MAGLNIFLYILKCFDFWDYQNVVFAIKLLSIPITIFYVKWSKTRASLALLKKKKKKKKKKNEMITAFKIKMEKCFIQTTI